MKGLKFLSWILLTVLLCSGCQAVTPAVDENGNIVADTYRSVKKIDASELKEVNIPEDASIICSYDDYVVYITEVEGTSDEQSDNSYNIGQLYIYDRVRDDSEYIAELGHVFSSTADGEYMDGKVYYPCVNENGHQLLISIDLESGAVENILDRDIWSIFYYMEKLDDSLILFSINGISGTDTEYRIDRIIPGNTTDIETILTKTASDNAGAEGEYISCIRTCKNNIYTYGASYNSQTEEWEYYIKEYNADGSQVNDYEINADDIDEFLYMSDIDNYDTVWNFDICDSYVMLHTINKRNKMFKLENGKLLNVNIPDELYVEDAGEYQMISDNAAMGGILYAAAAERNEENLYIFDAKATKFKVYTVPLAEDEHMNILYDTPNGELFIKIEQMTDEGYQNPRMYMIDGKKL